MSFGATQIEFLPVIEEDPNDFDTIFTTLKECIRHAGFAIVIFDFPIWLKAVNIIKQANLPIITWLGSFHLLKSYLGSMGNMKELETFPACKDTLQCLSAHGNHVVHY